MPWPKGKPNPKSETTKQRMKDRLIEFYADEERSKEQREQCRKMGRANKGKPQSEESNVKRSQTLTGRKYGPISEEHRKNLSRALKGKKKPPRSEDHRRKLSEVQRGKIVSEETKRKLSESHMGVKYGPPSEVTKQKISDTLMGHPVSEETKQKIRQALKGRPLSEEHKRILREANTGPNHYNWKGGPFRIYDTPEYRVWRTAVFERDNYTCQKCGAQGYLEAHHIKSVSDYPELIFDIDNGSTRCVPCHAIEHPEKHGLIMSREKVAA